MTPRPLGNSSRTFTAAALAAAVTLLLAVAPTAAHEGGPRLILDPAEVNPEALTAWMAYVPTGVSAGSSTAIVKWPSPSVVTAPRSA